MERMRFCAHDSIKLAAMFVQLREALENVHQTLQETYD